MVYTAETVLKFGKYKRCKLGDVPQEYLRQIYACKHPDADLIQYIAINLPHLTSRIITNRSITAKSAVPQTNFEKDISARLYGKTVMLVCKDTDKIIFVTEKDAKYEIRRAAGNMQSNKKPVRTYECEKCGGWHLTSIPHEKWEILNSKK